jgi:hypothetical protein
LGQRDGNKFNIIHHASHTLNEAQRNYSLAERELFSVAFACDKFRSYISDSKVKVHTNYNSLKEILEKTNPRALGQVVQRQVSVYKTIWYTLEILHLTPP